MRGLGDETSAVGASFAQFFVSQQPGLGRRDHSLLFGTLAELTIFVTVSLPFPASNTVLDPFGHGNQMTLSFGFFFCIPNDLADLVDRVVIRLIVYGADFDAALLVAACYIMWSTD